jgi:hypothetical protein
MTNKNLRLVSRKKAAEIAGVHERTVDYWRRTEKLTTYRERGFYVMIDLNELEEFLGTSPEPRDQRSA